MVLVNQPPVGEVMTRQTTYILLGVLGLFVMGGLFLYAFPVQVRVTASWPDEPLKVSHIYPLTFSFADYTVAGSLTTEGQFRVASGGQWEVSPKAADQLFSEVFKLGYGVRVEKDADNWREGTVSGAIFTAATDTAPAYFSVTLTDETTGGTLAAGDTVTIESVVTE